ncbi:MAG: chlorite dismutase family protein [Longimicrobiaceae bacterium]
MPPPIPPATLEGWYALHQVLETDWVALGALPGGKREELAGELAELFSGPVEPGAGWSTTARLAGGGADWLAVHLRPTLEELADLQLRLRGSRAGGYLHTVYDYLSVTEAGLYGLTAEVAGEALPGEKGFEERLAARVQAERESGYVRSRLYPELPDEMRYLSFYPMSKRREGEHNWYTLGIGERAALMREHGATGRRLRGRVAQIITGSVGLDDWEWGVTLFARDPLDLKRLVTEMRYDEASALYAEFGPFFTGVRFGPGEWQKLLHTEV